MKIQKFMAMVGAVVIASTIWALPLSAAHADFLPPEQAFVLAQPTVVDGGKAILLQWKIVDGYYLYRDKIKVRAGGEDHGFKLGTPVMPAGKTHKDPSFGTVVVYYHELRAQVPVSGAAAGSTVLLKVRYQGCADAGLCYPPQTRTVSVSMPSVGGGASTAAVATSTPAPPSGTVSRSPAAPSAGTPPESEQGKLVELLKNGSALAIIGAFFLAGLGLSLTPCVFPMIPILSGIIVGQGEGITTKRAFGLSAIYVFSMAATYTVAGVLAGLFGKNLQASLQNPWVISAFAAIFIALALSMFGLYNLQLPASWQSRLTEASNRQRGGTLIGVGVMGFLSALIVGPCVAAPIAAALIVIGQSGDPVLGGEALFALSLGMGAPLLLIGTSGGKLLPRAGAWMNTVKAVFGVVMLGVAIWMLERILPGPLTLVLWGLLLLVSAAYLGAFDALPEKMRGWRTLWKGFGIALALYGAALLLGASLGSDDPLQPLARLGAGGIATATAEPSHGLSFARVRNLTDLQAKVKAAASEGRIVMLDFYADWCVSCKELERNTFTDPALRAQLSNAVLLQADVTKNSADDIALMRAYHVIGPPTVLFFGANGNERYNLRVVGYLDASQFRARVNRVIN